MKTLDFAPKLVLRQTNLAAFKIFRENLTFNIFPFLSTMHPVYISYMVKPCETIMLGFKEKFSPHFLQTTSIFILGPFLYMDGK